MVWLLDESGDFNKKIPVHPNLAKPAAAKVLLDQPCCMFDPPILGIRTGQILVARNSAKFAHNVKIDGGDDNPNKNVAVEAGTAIEVSGWKASKYPVVVNCNIHSWMIAHIRVFDHPYFAVTNEQGEFEMPNAPAGKYRLVVWKNLWIVGKATGIPIEIKPGGTTELPPIKAKADK